MPLASIDKKKKKEKKAIFKKVAPRLSIETRENNFSQTLRRRCALEEIRDLSNSIFRSETEGEVRDGACFMVLLHLSECATATRYNRECPRRDAHTHERIRHIQPRYGHTLSSASSSRYLTNKLLPKSPLLPRRSRR